MPVITPPHASEFEQDRDLEQRVADLEALIEEARQRARRRRMRNGAALTLSAAVAVVGLIGFHGGGGGGGAALADRLKGGGHAKTPSPSLAGLPGGDAASAFAFDPRRPNVVYVASAHARGGSSVYKTIDDGRHWSVTGAQGTGWTSDILSLASDQQRPGTVYAGTDTAVYKTVDGGRSWRPFNRGLFFPYVGPRICHPQGSPRHCVRQRAAGTPGTPTWNRGNGWVLGLAVDPMHSNVVYAAAGGVRKSTDGGRTWRTVLVPKQWGDLSRIAIAPTHPESIYAIAHTYRDGGTPPNAPNVTTTVYKSTDAGRTWHVTGAGESLPPSCCGDSEDALAVDPGSPQTVYVVIGNSVLATTDGGASWQSIANGLPAGDVTSLAADPRRPGTMYASVQDALGRVRSAAVHGAVYKTINGGQTWREVYSGIGVETVAVDPARTSTIYAAGWAWNKGDYDRDIFRLLRSTDSGATWIAAS